METQTNGSPYSADQSIPEDVSSGSLTFQGATITPKYQWRRTGQQGLLVRPMTLAILEMVSSFNPKQAPERVEKSKK